MKHYNPSITERVKAIFNLKGDALEEVGDTLVPVIQILPRILMKQGNSGTLLTASTGKNTHIVGVTIVLTKTTANTGSYFVVNTTIGGSTITLGRFSGVTLTQESFAYYFPCNNVKIDPGATVAITATGTFDSVLVRVDYYEEEVTT